MRQGVLVPVDGVRGDATSELQDMPTHLDDETEMECRQNRRRAATAAGPSQGAGVEVPSRETASVGGFSQADGSDGNDAALGRKWRKS